MDYGGIDRYRAGFSCLCSASSYNSICLVASGVYSIRDSIIQHVGALLYCSSLDPHVDIEECMAELRKKDISEFVSDVTMIWVMRHSFCLDESSRRD